MATMDVTPFPYARRLDMESTGEPPSPCVICGDPGPMVPMFSNLKPNLCVEHFLEAAHPSQQTLDK